MHVLVVTCAHRGDDARIVHRQARSLLEHGYRVTLVSSGVDDTSADPPGLERVVIRRAVGRRRIAAWVDVRRALTAHLPRADIVLIHDPELVLVLGRVWRRCPVVWDVHEDFVASVTDRTWIPRPARALVAAVVRFVQRRAARRLRIIVAEDSYLSTFPGAPVVPNSTWMPDLSPGSQPMSIDHPPRLVYVGRISRARGAEEMIEVGRRLRGRISVVLVGSPDADVADLVRSAHHEGIIDARGPLPNPEALAVVRGALAGLSLLHDIANYRHSRPTKIAEYLANGVPVITTPLPLAVEMVEQSSAGITVAHGDIAAVADEVAQAASALASDLGARQAMGAAGRRFVAEHHSWDVDGERFVALVEGWAR